MLFKLTPPDKQQHKRLDELAEAVAAIEAGTVSPHTVRNLALYANAAMLSTAPITALDFWRMIPEATGAIQKAGSAALPIVATTQKRLEDNQEGYTIPDALQEAEQTYKPMPAGVLPEYIEKYVQMVAESQQQDRAAVVCGVLGAMAAATMGKFWVKHPDSTGHHEHLPLYIVVIQAPSQRKSGALNECIKPIFEYLRDAVPEYKKQCVQAEQRRKAAKARAQELEKRIAKAAEDEAEREHLTKLLGEAGADYAAAENPPNPHIIHSDITPEALAIQMLNSNQTAFLTSAEASTLEILAGMYTGGAGVNVSIFNAAYSAEPCRMNRARDNREILLDRPLLTILQYVQPSIWREVASNRRLRGSGFIARISQCSIPSAYRTSYRNEKPYIKALYDEYAATIADFFAIQRPEVPRELTFSAEAAKIMEMHMQPILDGRLPGGRFEGFEDAAGKLPGVATRIAGLLHLLRYPCTPAQYAGEDNRAVNKPISAETAENACKIAEFFADNMVESAGDEQRELAQAEHKLLDKIVQRTIYAGRASCNLNDLKRDTRRTYQAETIEALVNAGIIEIVTASSKGTKKKTEVFLNPYVFAEIAKETHAEKPHV